MSEQRKRCGECDTCKELEEVKKRVLACCNPPFSHADQGVVDLWNRELDRLPCEEWATACPGCGCLPGDGLTEGCDHPDGRGFSRSQQEVRGEYPRCPRCGRAVVGAMMTGRGVTVAGEFYYHADDISVYCESGDCNYDQKLRNLPTPSREAAVLRQRPLSFRIGTVMHQMTLLAKELSGAFGHVEEPDPKVMKEFCTVTRMLLAAVSVRPAGVEKAAKATEPLSTQPLTGVELAILERVQDLHAIYSRQVKTVADMQDALFSLQKKVESLEAGEDEPDFSAGHFDGPEEKCGPEPECAE